MLLDVGIHSRPIFRALTDEAVVKVNEVGGERP